MSKLDIAFGLIGFLAVLYGPVLISACRQAYRIGKLRGQDEASQLWPQHSDDARAEPAPFAPDHDDDRSR